MSSFENDIREQMLRGEGLPPRLDINIIKYLWHASPLSLGKGENIHGFLSNVPLFNHFTDYELRIFSRYIHRRNFYPKETVFRQGDTGYGFYFILQGSIDILTEIMDGDDVHFHHVINLKRCQYFGEMGLLEEFNTRNASAVASEETVLLGLFKPDLEELLDQHPVVGAKFLREVSLILAARVSDLVREIMTLKKKMNPPGRT
jgi:CRP/FNR family transcriptional regulator, cyclic AMP receptor protein